MDVQLTRVFSVYMNAVLANLNARASVRNRAGGIQSLNWIKSPYASTHSGGHPRD